MNRALLAALLAAIAFVSGCTYFGGGTGVGTGVAVDYFAPDFSQVFAGETVTFQVRIQNRGSAVSDGGQLRLLGLDWEDGGFGIGAGQSCETFGRLIPGDPTAGTQGETHVCSISRKAPQTIPQGITQQYTPTLRLSYSYSTDTVKAVTLASREELKSIENSGRSLPAETVSTTAGPVAISVVSKGPIRIYGSQTSFPVEIAVSNVGGGVVCGQESGDCANPSNWNKLTLAIQTGGGLTHNCKNDLTLFRGQSNSAVCLFTTDGAGTASGPVVKTITVHADYGYFVDRPSSVAVQWTPKP